MSVVDEGTESDLESLDRTEHGDDTISIGVGQTDSATGPTVNVNQDMAALAGFETIDDAGLTAATAIDRPGGGSGADLDAKIRRHLGDDHRATDPMVGTVIGERFEVQGRIGSGGMGAVYRARQRGMGRDVAIKVLLQDVAQNENIGRRFTIEALAVSRLKHPNTIQIFDFGRTDQGNLYIAMELLEGQTLGRLLETTGRVAIRRALKIIAAAASSLAEAHDKDIIHRDLKPENVFLIRVGENPDFVKVLDFGVAKLQDGAGDGKGTLTKAGSIFGTPRYMSPEQAAGRPADGRADLYSLGVILYELICGRPPFVDERPLQLLLAHSNQRPAPPSAICPELAIPRDVEALIMSLLEKSPSDRVQSASDLTGICLDLVETLPAAFDAQVLMEGSGDLRVELSTPATMDVARAAAAADSTLDIPAAEIDVVAPLLVAPSSPPNRWILPMLALGGVGVGLLTVTLALKAGVPATPIEARQTEPGATVEVAQSPKSAEVVHLPAASTLVRISVVTRPPGAEVHALGGAIQGELLGVTPVDLERPRDSRLSVRIRAAGHQTTERELAFVRHMAVDLTLRPLPIALPAVEGDMDREPNRRVKPRPRRAFRPKPTKIQGKLPAPAPKAEQLVDELL